MKGIEIRCFKAFNDNSIILGDPDCQEDKNILCYGENGSGKTSIYEAIKYFFFKDRIINENVPKYKVGDERKAEIQQLENSYRNNTTTSQKIVIEVDHKSIKDFNFEEQDAYLISSKDLEVSNEIDIHQLLERCYMSRFENVAWVDEYIEYVIEEVNRLLDKYFYSDVEICLSQNKGRKIVIKDRKRNLNLDMCLSDNFNESIIHIIKLLIILSFVTLYQDPRRASLLVFDDIVTSMDNLYRSFLYRYIRNEFKNFQIVFLTHSTSFFNLCDHWINEKNENDKWIVQSLYEYGGNHKIYTKGKLNTDILKQKLVDGNQDITTLGNETRQLFEMLVQQFCMFTMIGAKEETDKLISEIAKKESQKYFSVDGNKLLTDNDLLNKIRSLLNSCPKEKQLEKITSAINNFEKGSFGNMSAWLDEMKIYQKSTLHQASHGHIRLPDITLQEIKASLCVLEQLESTIKKLKIGRIQA